MAVYVTVLFHNWTMMCTMGQGGETEQGTYDCDVRSFQGRQSGCITLGTGQGVWIPVVRYSL